MRRREFLGVLSGTAAWPVVARAQQQRAKIPRVGYLFPFIQEESQELWQACRRGIRDQGYVEGQSILLEPRWAEGRYERLPDFMAELLRIKVDALVSAATAATRAAMAKTKTTPIIFAAVADPVESGIVSSLARPTGNVTGFSNLTADLSGKRLQLLTEIIRKVSHVGVLLNPNQPVSARFLNETTIAARQLGIELQVFEARQPDELDNAFASLTTDRRVDALIVFDDPALWSFRTQIVALAAARKIPTVYGFKDFVSSGGLMSYGPDRLEQYRRTAIYVDKILKGAKPTDLPVEQPTKFELFLNLRTAQALALTIPPTLLARADEVIE
jgi:putative ABC transport system substrate-binding protein